jgi:hypothetical protein
MLIPTNLPKLSLVTGLQLGKNSSIHLANLLSPASAPQALLLWVLNRCSNIRWLSILIL